MVNIIEIPEYLSESNYQLRNIYLDREHSIEKFYYQNNNIIIMFGIYDKSLRIEYIKLKSEDIIEARHILKFDINMKLKYKDKLISLNKKFLLSHDADEDINFYFSYIMINNKLIHCKIIDHKCIWKLIS